MFTACYLLSLKLFLAGIGRLFPFEVRRWREKSSASRVCHCSSSVIAAFCYYSLLSSFISLSFFPFLSLSPSQSLSLFFLFLTLSLSFLLFLSLTFFSRLFLCLSFSLSGCFLLPRHQSSCFNNSHLFFSSSRQRHYISHKTYELIFIVFLPL